MMYVSQEDRLHHLHGVKRRSLGGVKVDSSGDLAPDWASSSLPDALALTYKVSSAQQYAGDTFLTVLANMIGKDEYQVWNAAAKERRSLKTVNQIEFLRDALAKSAGISNNDAEALADYVGGAVLHRNVLGYISPAAVSSSDYLDVGSLVSAHDKSTSIEGALLRLKSANPIAHNYVVHLIGNKAALKQGQEEWVAGKVVAKEQVETGTVVQKTAKQAEELAKGAVKGLGDVFSLGAWVASNAGWLLVAGGALWLYMSYRNRSAIAQLASATRKSETEA